MTRDAATDSRSTAIDLARAPGLGWPTILACVLGTLLMHGSVLIARYGSTDDFWLYFQSWQPDEARYPATIYLSAARPITAWAWSTVRPGIESTADLIPLRFMSLLGLMALALCVVDACRESMRRETHRVFLALAVLALPVCTTFAAWATVWIYPWSAVAALLAARFIGDSLVPLEPSFPRGSIIRICQALTGIAFAILAAVISLGIYQPTFGWYWLAPLAMAWSAWFQAMPRAHQRYWVQFGFGVIALAGAFFAQRLVPAVAGIALQDRSDLVLRPWEKLEAALRVQVPIVSNGWFIVDATRKWQVAILGCLILGLVLVLVIRAARGQDLRAAVLGVSQVTLALALCHVHWWAVAYTAKNYRTSGALTASLMVTLAIALAVTYERRFACEKPRSDWLKVMTWGLSFTALVVGAFNTWYYWVSPLSRSLAYLQKQVLAELTPETREIHIVRQRQFEGLVPGQPIYEHGQPLTDFEWAIDGVVIAALRDAGLDLGRIKVTHSRPSRPSLHPPAGVPADIPTPPEGTPGVIVVEMKRLVE